MSVGEFKTHFSKVVEWGKQGNKVAVTFGKKKEIIGYFIPNKPSSLKKTTLAIMEGKARAVFIKTSRSTKKNFCKNDVFNRYKFLNMEHSSTGKIIS